MKSIQHSKYKRLNSLLFVLLFCSALIYGCAEPADFTVQYNKQEYRIPMRDGKTLFTAVYTPRDTNGAYPILLNRTPYSVAPYGSEAYKSKLGPSEFLSDEKYIFVYQDVRGKFMSEGEYLNMRPFNPDKQSAQDIDESSDTYDTIEWLINNIRHHNGNVGMWGISYPGFYTTMGALSGHPALKAVSPQAPIADWFIGDDVHHNGAFGLLLSFNFFASFGKPRPELTQSWGKRFDLGTPDAYRFFLDLGPLPNVNKKYFDNKIRFWNALMEHGTYDQFWKSRNILPHLSNIKPAVLTVGGWYDSEDLYGSLNTYKSIEAKNPLNENFLVMGPWSHGGWARSEGDRLGAITFDAKTSLWYQQHVELPFFNYYLKGKGAFEKVEARCFDTGTNQWHDFEEWPPLNLEKTRMYFSKDEGLYFDNPAVKNSDYFDQFVSDPDNPVPFTNEITHTWGQKFMVEDQRFADRRPDVLTYKTEPLDQSVRFAGPIRAALQVSTGGSDCDWVVKLIDVYPDSIEEVSDGQKMGGYQRLVRAEIFRSKFRNSFFEPEPMMPGQKTAVEFILQDVLHTFKRDHRIMIQIQSSWFPLFDRNPQKFVDIYSAGEQDFQKAGQRVYHDSYIEAMIY